MADDNLPEPNDPYKQPESLFIPLSTTPQEARKLIENMPPEEQKRIWATLPRDLGIIIADLHPDSRTLKQIINNKRSYEFKKKHKNVATAHLPSALSNLEKLQGKSEWREERPGGDLCITGKISEMLAATDLLSRGLYVYINAAHQGPSDLIALGSDFILKIEVRTGRLSSNGCINYPKDTHGAIDVIAVVVPLEGVFYFPPLVEAISNARKRGGGYKG